MNRSIRFLVPVLFFITCCKTPAGFITGNEVHHSDVILVYRNHNRVPGKIDISFENNTSFYSEYRPYIMFTPVGKDTALKVTLNTIEGYWIDSSYYILKKVDMFMNGTNRLLFVKRLTAENSRIALFEEAEAGPASERTGEDRSYYFLSFAGDDLFRTLNTRSSAIVPGFDRKMSRLLADCPALANKIVAKADGYFLPMGSVKRGQIPEVLMRIIKEYDSCR